MTRFALTLLALTAAAVAIAQEPARPLAVDQFKQANASLRVSSEAFPPNGSIPSKYADYGEKVSPHLSWSGSPASAQTLVILAEDPDAKEPKPFVHWVLYNLPASFTSLPEAVPGTPRLPEFGGALQGRNSKGTFGYFGPRPPQGDPPHHYHFQVFAIDTILNLEPGATATAVIAAMKGHVVARGERVGVYSAR